MRSLPRRPAAARPRSGRSTRRCRAAATTAPGAADAGDARGELHARRRRRRAPPGQARSCTRRRRRTGVDAQRPARPRGRRRTNRSSRSSPAVELQFLELHAPGRRTGGGCRRCGRRRPRGAAQRLQVPAPCAVARQRGRGLGQRRRGRARPGAPRRSMRASPTAICLSATARRARRGRLPSTRRMPSSADAVEREQPARRGGVGAPVERALQAARPSSARQQRLRDIGREFWQRQLGELQACRAPRGR